MVGTSQMRQATAKGESMKPTVEIDRSTSERRGRNNTITLMALYDAVETAPGKWRPYTLDEIGGPLPSRWVRLMVTALAVLSKYSCSRNRS